jgi:hypothetical protein
MVNPTQVTWLAYTHTIRERTKHGEIATSLVVFIVMGSRVVQNLIKKGIKAAGVWYQVQAYTKKGPISRCELFCGWGLIENMCGTRPRCGYCTAHDLMSDQKCNLVGCTAKHRALCGHTLENCPNCKGNHIALSSRFAKKPEATKGAL